MADSLMTGRINLVVLPSLLSDVDEWRRAQPVIPTRSDAVRMFLERGIAATKAEQGQQ